ncbi:uncharacterized protein LOC117646856 [Thrips palmi]|uniref:Uncharacterized protein LOC117646856 n=1 Tax=Thrips palmi TaxID=161013 RepID=A0A6P8ZPF7_THRPL|nr:uncharacterized protein LOC117646856 [Thrips palmi]
MTVTVSISRPRSWRCRLPEGEEVCLLSDTDTTQLLWGVSAEEIVPSVPPSDEIVSSVGVRDNGESSPKQVVAVKKEIKPRRKGRQHRVQQKKANLCSQGSTKIDCTNSGWL